LRASSPALLAVLLDSGDSHSLRCLAIGERHPTNRCGLDAEAELSLASDGRDRTGIVLVAKGSQPGQDCTEDGLGKLYLDVFFRFNTDRANATLAGAPVEFKSHFLA